MAAGEVTVVDIRDPRAYAEGRMPGAFALSDATVEAFLAATDRDRPVVVCCYHGISSRGAASWLVEQGFREVYSLEGGFCGWESEGRSVER